MTSAEWMDAFRKGDPDALGTAVRECLEQAFDRVLNNANMEAPDVGELAPPWVPDTHSSERVHAFCVVVAQIMREQGLLYQLPGGTS